MKRELYECCRCGYLYPPFKMVKERTSTVHGRDWTSETKVYCLDRVRCDRHIAQREADKAVLK